MAMDQLVAVVGNAGVAGAVAAWFMLRAEKRLLALEKALDRFSRVMLIAAMAAPRLPDEARAEARSMLREMRGEE
jgi:hypothetical protein